MIQLAEDIGPMESRKVSLQHPRYKHLFIEVASTRKIDVAIVDEDQLEAFDNSEVGTDAAIDWVENTRTYQYELILPDDDDDKRYLLFWNSNEPEPAIVAYKITAVDTVVA